MLSSSLLSLLLVCALGFWGLADAIEGRPARARELVHGDQGQIPIGFEHQRSEALGPSFVVKGPPIARPERPKVTIRSTTTRTTYSTTWVTVTPTGLHPKPVQTWYGGQKKKGCDRTACVSCRWWYNCAGGEPNCFVCDTAPYCEACMVEDEREEEKSHLRLDL